ncbi:MAG: 3,4-dihydroxy-2-butanone 4-phosphate synthase [Crenarchaeota archaeon]|nr:3,4-dihydroxy-2-butanone 4-phosphate synthase [Thermoproteota archaeon]
MIDRAVEKLRNGDPVLIFDFENRECEVDMVFRASLMSPEKVRLMRRLAGGLICFVTTYDIGRKLGLDLHTRMLAKLDGLGRLIKTPRYGDEPAFSIWVNHIDVKTGIRDIDRALTLRELSNIVRLVVSGWTDIAREEFYNKFYAPGHVPILLGRVGDRWGHTELSLILSKIANIEPALVICEILGDSTDVPSLDECKKIAERLGTVLISGSELCEIYRKVVRQ